MTNNINIADCSDALVDAIVGRHCHRPGALLPVLHAIQDALGYIPRAVVGQVADGLNLSRAEVHGVISFYHDFRYAPGPQIRICMGEACQSMGSAALLAQATAILGDGVEPVYCVGNCACAPNIEISHAYHGRMSQEKLASLLASEVAA
ncbi:MAG: NAD(P)H-dependent oxidoreductase subunit E [Halomonas sp.]|nr:NAD(P)H-dependent oxidoreductase subunit E [Halomonas sp.]